MAFLEQAKKMFSAVWPTSHTDDDEAKLSTEAAQELLVEQDAIKLWNQRLRNARTFFEPDFKQMKENMEFAG